MSDLAAALAAIALSHHPTTHRVRGSKLRPNVYHNEPACRDCEWTGTGSLMESHAEHVAALQVAYLRDRWGEAMDEINTERARVLRASDTATNSLISAAVLDARASGLGDALAILNRLEPK